MAALPTPSSASSPPPRSFHRRPLPAPAVAFSSSEGKKLFAEALQEGTLGCFFRLIEQFHTQGEPAYCGLGTLAMVLNALGVDPKRVWKGPWRWFSEQLLDCCEPLDVVKERGITFNKVACLARCNGAHVEAQRLDEATISLQSFREKLLRSCKETEEEFQVMIVSYSRKALGQTGDGHYSPIGGYHAATDRVLILDVARFKYPPHWVPLETLWEAMSYIDTETGRSRGFMILRSNASLNAARMALVWRWPECSEDAKNADSTISGFQTSFASALSTPAWPVSAAEVLRRSLRFIESPKMPLRVVCKMPEVSLEAEKPAEQLMIRELTELAKALAEFAEKLNLQLGEKCFEVEEITTEAVKELKCPNLDVAAVLAIEPTLWQQVLERATSDGSDGPGAWEVLRPLLTELPEPLRKDIQVLRSQWADLLTAREEMCRSVPDAGGRSRGSCGCGYAKDADASAAA